MRNVHLPGLERLLATCERLGLPVKWEPPGPTPPEADSRIGGMVVDPLLAAVYARLGWALLAEDLYLLRCTEHQDEFREVNELSPADWQKDFQVLVFGGKASLACSYATVPHLADAQGHQPVVRVNTSAQPYALPIASNIDRFFDTWSRYLELLAPAPGPEEERLAAPVFPWEVPELLAQDTRLVELLRAGAFDPLARNVADVRDWMDEVLAAAGEAS